LVYTLEEDITLISLNIEDLLPRFESFRVALVVAENLVVTNERSEELEQFILEVETKVANLLKDRELGDLPQVKSWRTTYTQFGVKKTSYRSSVERLLKAIQNGKGLPRIYNLVDAYNAISILWQMPVGADDLDKVFQPQVFRFAYDNDTFIALGDRQEANDPPQIGEIVYADSQKCLCRRWNWYQDARSAVGINTTSAVLTVQAIEPTTAAKVEDGAAELCSLLDRVCGTKTQWAIADANTPQISLKRD
jgi:DNA/RNA-binding domain of Phe-tRNA-synthetase-like protein